MLEREFQFYKREQDELVQRFNGKHLLIVGEEVVGAFDTYLDAYVAGKNQFQKGSFLIQLCEPGPESFTKRFHARVSFKKNNHAA